MNDKSKIDLLLRDIYDRARRMRVRGIDLERCYQDIKREAAQIVMLAGYDWAIWCSPVSQHLHDLLVCGR